MKELKLTDHTAEWAFVLPFVTNFARAYYPEASELLSAEMFDNTKCRDIWQAITNVETRNEETNLLSVYAELQRLGSKVEMVDLMHNSEVTNVVNYSTSSALYLRDLYDRRELLKLLTVQRDELADLTTPYEDVVAKIKSYIDKSIASHSDHEYTMEQMGKELLEATECRMNGNDELISKTGYNIVDEVGALQPTDLNVVAGESSMGKTAFALNVALNVAKNGASVAIYSLEMGTRQLMARFASIEGEGINSSDILYRPLNDDQFSNLYNTVMKLSDLPIYVDNSSSYNINKLCANIRRMVLNHQVSVIVIDYLQLISTDNRNANDEQELAKTTRTLKNLAKELEVCIILLSQLNRPKEGTNPVPTMRRLRGSGQIEEAADNIYMIYRAERYNRAYPGGWSPYPTEGTALVIRAKGRNGGVGERLLDFIPERTKFVERNYKPDAVEAETAKHQEQVKAENGGRLDGAFGPSPF